MLMQRTLGFDFETADAADTMAKLSLSAPSAPVVAAPLRRGRSAGGEHAAPLHADSAPFVNRSSIAFGYNRYGGGGMAASAMPPMMAVSYPPGTLGAHWQTQWLIMKAQFDEREVARRRVEEEAERNAPPKTGSCAGLSQGLAVTLAAKECGGKSGVVVSFKGRGWVVVKLDGKRGRTVVVRGNSVRPANAKPTPPPTPLLRENSMGSDDDAAGKQPTNANSKSKSKAKKLSKPKKAKLKVKLQGKQSKKQPLKSKGKAKAKKQRQLQEMPKSKPTVGPSRKRGARFCRGDRVQMKDDEKNAPHCGLRAVVTIVRGRGWLSVRLDGTREIVRTRASNIEIVARRGEAMPSAQTQPSTPPSSPPLTWTHRRNARGGGGKGGGSGPKLDVAKGGRQKKRASHASSSDDDEEEEENQKKKMMNKKTKKKKVGKKTKSSSSSSSSSKTTTVSSYGYTSIEIGQRVAVSGRVGIFIFVQKKTPWCAVRPAAGGACVNVRRGMLTVLEDPNSGSDSSVLDNFSDSSDVVEENARERRPAAAPTRKRKASRESGGGGRGRGGSSKGRSSDGASISRSSSSSASLDAESNRGSRRGAPLGMSRIDLEALALSLGVKRMTYKADAELYMEINVKQIKAERTRMAAMGPPAKSKATASEATTASTTMEFKSESRAAAAVQRPPVEEKSSSASASGRTRRRHSDRHPNISIGTRISVSGKAGIFVFVKKKTPWCSVRLEAGGACINVRRGMLTVVVGDDAASISHSNEGSGSAAAATAEPESVRMRREEGENSTNAAAADANAAAKVAKVAVEANATAVELAKAAEVKAEAAAVEADKAAEAATAEAARQKQEHDAQRAVKQAQASAAAAAAAVEAKSQRARAAAAAAAAATAAAAANAADRDLLVGVAAAAAASRAENAASTASVSAFAAQGRRERNLARTAAAAEEAAVTDEARLRSKAAAAERVRAKAEAAAARAKAREENAQREAAELAVAAVVADAAAAVAAASASASASAPLGEAAVLAALFAQQKRKRADGSETTAGRKKRTRVGAFDARSSDSDSDDAAFEGLRFIAGSALTSPPDYFGEGLGHYVGAVLKVFVEKRGGGGRIKGETYYDIEFEDKTRYCLEVRDVDRNFAAGMVRGAWTGELYM